MVRREWNQMTSLVAFYGQTKQEESEPATAKVRHGDDTFGSPLDW
jgi:hypothetical protein